MKKALSLILLHSLLISCAHNGLKTELGSVKEDALSEESFMRYSSKRHQDMTENSQSVIIQALSQCHQGKIEQGRDLLVKSLTDHRDDPLYWNAVANCYSLEKNYPKALFYYDMSQALNTNSKVGNALIHNNKAYILMKLRHFDQARIELQEAIKLAPTLKTPRYNFAQLNIQFGHTDIAERELRTLLKNAPDDIDILSALGVINLYKNQIAEARALFEKIPDRLRRREDIAIHYAMSLYLTGELELSRAVLLRLGVFQVPSLKVVNQSLNRWIDHDLELQRKSVSQNGK